MEIPPDVRFRHWQPSPAVVAAARERVDKLDRFHPHIISCRVMIEAIHQQHLNGTVYHVRVDLSVPRREIVAKSESVPGRFHEDVYVAIRDAFDEARRELQDDIRTWRDSVR